MDEAEIADLRARVETLTQEKASLLEELETVYLQLEEHLAASEREREIAYHELRDRNRELENRLEELEKAHRELQEAQRMLVRSERLAAMGEMAAAIVHEIRNPLTVIIARVDMMKLKGGVPDLRNLDILQESGEYLKGLTENILRFARHHRGEASQVNLNALLADVEAFVRPIVRGVEIELDLTQGIPHTLADRGQVEQVLVNLILNAVDALGRGGRIWLTTGKGSIQAAIEGEVAAGRPHTLAVEMGEESLAEDFVFAEVRDDGPGISEAHMAQLFEAFFTTKGEEKGTGLGLSIARTIVGEWGGNILLTSREEEGASFKVFLPSAPAQD